MTDAAPPAAPPAAPSVGPLGPRRPAGWEAVLAFAAAFALLAAFAGVRDLWDADEGRYASVALDMGRTGDFVTPRENGLRFMDKPPLVYWMANGAFALLGPTPLAARLPCIASGAVLALFAFLFGAAWTGSRRAAWLAALVVASSLGGMGFSRTVTMDMPLSACVAGALWAGWRGLASDGWRPRAGLGLAVGLGLLAKGPLAAVVPALVAAGWGLTGARWGRVLRLLFSPLAWGVAVAVAAPWYALCERANPGYLEHFVVYEHFRRFQRPGHRDFRPFWLYAATLALMLVPWTHLLWRARLARPVADGLRRPVPATRFAWAWALVLLAFYTLGENRLFTYILPAFLPLAVLAGARLAQVLAADDARARRTAWWGAASALPLAAVAAALATGIVFRQDLAFEAFGERLLPWTETRLQPAGWPVVAGCLPLLLAPLAFRLVRAPAARAAVLVLAASAMWWGVDLGAARVDDLRSARRLAAVLVAEQGPEDLVVHLDHLPQGLRVHEPSLFVSVAGKQPEIVEPWASKDGEGRLFSVAQAEGLWASDRRVLLVARQRKADDWRARLGGRVLAEGLSGAQRADLVVLENRPRR